MKGTPAIYLGRIVDKEKFRTFIYSADGEKKLVESWDAFEAAMESGLWFATIEDAAKSLGTDHVITVDQLPSQVHGKPKPKARSKPKPKSAPIVERPADKVEVSTGDNMVFEVTDENR